MKTDIPHTQIAIIGAGLAGATFSYFAQQQHIPCLVIEKSRGTGGRAGSKRLEQGSVDLGASIISFGDEELAHLRETLLKANVIERWQSAYVGVPKMSAISRYLLQDTPLLTGNKAHHIERQGKSWLIRDESYQPICYAENVILATPALQSAMLLASIPNSGALLQFANQAGSQTLPQWAMWVTTHATEHAPLVPCQHEVLESIIKDSDKPQRPASTTETWVIQASPQWSKKHLDTPKSEVLAEMIQAFSDVTGVEVLNAGEPHRWLLGRQVMALAPQPFMWDSTLNVGLIGDWLCQGDAEGAMLSAKFAFDAIGPTFDMNNL
ncbi:NAD(P)/FAD-dependent oxidoreductase [Marinomonas fungiae]|uniref:Predicted NAD/FAD-dependent oxidoreductase n=1 Tax=Marinomonas fungiae TaxID=1137284 RepID=A0A0K6IP50_9GAMM|nr:NAD(P)-binding protein [Marinomonas fungiae]CUB04871.1 Predicted NAD/FAD-dependent oxidoreductase [Marinomonas fungiae]